MPNSEMSLFDKFTNTLSLAADYEINRIKAKASVQRPNDTSPAYQAADSFDRSAAGRKPLLLGFSRNQLLLGIFLLPLGYFTYKKLF